MSGAQYPSASGGTPENRARVVQLLPASLQTRLAEDHCSEAVRRNMHLFAGCDIQFRLRFMMHLQVRTDAATLFSYRARAVHTRSWLRASPYAC